jgi:predicted small lipoprotein YifL
MEISTRRRLICFSLLAVAAVLTNACGRKGPLYLPEDEGGEKKDKKEKTTALGQRRSLRA